MKKIFKILLSLTLFMSFALPTVYAAESEGEANSWRYENGQWLEDLSPMARASHPDATLTGIDVSEHQGTIDWEKVQAAGIDFAIIRCGYGQDMTSQDDLYFEYNADECERLGIPYGVYLYSYATNTTRADSEADHVLRLLEGRNLSYPVYFDMEDASTIGTDLAAIAETFCDKISDAGYPVGVYANLNWWNNYLTDPCFDDWHRWVAQYNSCCQYTGSYALWQYTSSGSVNGISGRVDMNYQIGYPADHGFSSAETALKTDKNTYQSGEAIMVTASSGKAGAWVAVYGEEDTISSATPSYYWYYVNGREGDKAWKNGETYNIYDGICSMRPLNGQLVSGALPAGKYTVAILYGDYQVQMRKEITIKAPSDRPSLQVSQDAYLVGEDIDVTAVSYEDGAWAGIYHGTPDTFDSDYIYYFYTECKNGLTMTMQDQQKNASSPYVDLPAGTYTVVLFGDNGYSDPVMQKQIKIANIYTDKTTYAYGEPIMVSAAHSGSSAWVGLYKETDTYEADLSFYWYYLSEKGDTANILAATSNDRKGFTAGDYKVVLFADGGYRAVDSVSVTITKEEARRDVITEPTCSTAGFAIVYYTDGTHEILPLPVKTHEYTAKVTEPTCTEDGFTTYTCICKDSYVADPVPFLGHSFQNYISNGDGTKTAKCIRCSETDTLPDEVIPPAEAEVFRVYGTSRCDTAMEAADTLKEVMGVTEFDTVIVANAQNFADALGGSYLAAAKDAPILMTNIQSEAKVKDYIRNNLKQGGTIYILGGPLAVASSFEAGMDDFNVKRLYGTSRYDTNLAILKEAGVNSGSEVLVCTGTNFADSLSASATGKPILMVGNSLTGNQKAYLESLAAEYTIIGGPLAVNANVENELDSIGETARIYGTSRFDTSVVVAKQFFTSPEVMVLAYAQNFPDGLSGGPLAYQAGGPLVLTQNGKHAAAMTYASENNIQNGYVMGGPMLISDDTAKVIFDTDSIGIQ